MKGDHVCEDLRKPRLAMRKFLLLRGQTGVLCSDKEISKQILVDGEKPTFRPARALGSLRTREHMFFWGSANNSGPRSSRPPHLTSKLAALESTLFLVTGWPPRI